MIKGLIPPMFSLFRIMPYNCIGIHFSYNLAILRLISLNIKWIKKKQTIFFFFVLTWVISFFFVRVSLTWLCVYLFSKDYFKAFYFILGMKCLAFVFHVSLLSKPMMNLTFFLSLSLFFFLFGINGHEPFTFIKNKWFIWVFSTQILLFYWLHSR